MKRAIALAACLLAAACGFHLRVDVPFAFQRMSLSGPEGSPLYNDLRRVLSSRKGLTVTTDEKSAQVTLKVVSDVREKIILSLTGQGLVREFQLRQRVNYVIGGPSSPETATPGEFVVTRVLLYSDTAILAKQSEEALLYRDMESDALQQMMRRLAAVKPPL